MQLLKTYNAFSSFVLCLLAKFSLRMIFNCYLLLHESAKHYLNPNTLHLTVKQFKKKFWIPVQFPLKVDFFELYLDVHFGSNKLRLQMIYECQKLFAIDFPTFGRPHLFTVSLLMEQMPNPNFLSFPLLKFFVLLRTF